LDSFFEETPAAPTSDDLPPFLDEDEDFCFSTLTAPYELAPPLCYRKSTIITVILSEPTPSFYYISSNEAGHISSNKL